MTIQTDTLASDPATSDAEKQSALTRLLSAAAFQTGERKRDFLRYMVEEENAGRGDQIRGKTIAQDVYGRDPLEQGDPENVLRVDARRLREILELYYETEGQGDPVRIHLDSGGYCPRFERADRAPKPAPRSRAPLRLILVFAAGLAVGAILGFALSRGPDDRPADVAGLLQPAQALQR